LKGVAVFGEVVSDKPMSYGEFYERRKMLEQLVSRLKGK
jgi:hypothetical protein